MIQGVKLSQYSVNLRMFLLMTKLMIILLMNQKTYLRNMLGMMMTITMNLFILPSSVKPQRAELALFSNSPAPTRPSGRPSGIVVICSYRKLKFSVLVPFDSTRKNMQKEYLIPSPRKKKLVKKNTLNWLKW